MTRARAASSGRAETGRRARLRSKARRGSPAPDGLSTQQPTVGSAVWVALDWGSYRTLTEQAGLSAAEYEAWLSRYDASMLLAVRRRVP